MKKTQQEIQQELIKEFGQDYNNIDNLIKLLNTKYHPKYFNSMKEFSQTQYFKIKGDILVQDYTDDYITEEDSYIIILFDDSRDFGCEENCNDDVIVCYEKKSGKILKFYYTGYNNEALHYIQNFIDSNKNINL